jgi:tetratricopeptide (TPR) repeat protein
MSIPLRLQQATAHHQAGRLAEAHALYRQILAAEPDHPDALHLLGVLTHQAGHPAQAEPLIRRALARQPQAFVYFNSLGNVLRGLSRPAEAEAAYRAALRLQPNTPDFHHHLGLALRDQNRTEDAETAFRHAIRLRRDFVPARIDLGNLLVEAGRGVDAEACVRAALRSMPENPVALNALGLALAAQGKHEASLQSFDQALALAPTSPSALANRAAALASLERFEEAVPAYRAALAQDPAATDLRTGLARTLLRLKRGDESEPLLRELLAERPHDAEILHGLGAAMAMRDRSAEALDFMRAATRADPAHAAAWHAIGLALRDLARWPETLEPFAEAVRQEPENAEYHASYACALLANGAYETAWPHFVWRVKQPGNARLAEPQWDGAPTERTVLVHAEQGLGDAIQFCRFVPLAAARARILLACPPTLTPLFAGLPGVAAVVDGEPVPPYDLQCPLMSLPSVLGVQPAAFGAAVPYLHAAPQRIAAWRARFADLPGRRVGLVWAGNPHYPADRRRSLPFSVLAPVLDVPGFSFVSLQIGETACVQPDGLFDAAPYLRDFTETAAAIAALDLVISVDTAVAHLAGALGRPVWLLNRADTDWRWLLEHSDSPWYPTMRIFRQPTPGDWAGAVGSVANALLQLGSGHASPAWS